MTPLKQLTGSTLLAIASTGVVAAQDVRFEMACGDDQYGGRRATNICETREFTLTAREALHIDGSPNGSVTITGWDNDEILVRARLQSWDRDEDLARERLASIGIELGRVIEVSAPDNRNLSSGRSRRNGSWVVNFEIMAPPATDIRIETVNGRIGIANMQSELDIATTNGRIDLNDVAASVRGRTTNGGISASFADAMRDGDGIDLRTTNGGIVMRFPEEFSADLDIETVNGGISSDFPIDRHGNRNREVTATLGAGGPLIRARTTNGGVQIRQY